MAKRFVCISFNERPSEQEVWQEWYRGSMIAGPDREWCEATYREIGWVRPEQFVAMVELGAVILPVKPKKKAKRAKGGA